MARKNAWNDYAAAPGYQRRRDRLWGWRAKPSRPLTWAALALIGALAMGKVVAPVIHHQTSEWEP
jgi:hypothetical protein